MPKSSTHQLLNVMRDHDLVQYDPRTKSWSLGPECANLGSAYLSSDSLLTTAQPYLQELSDELRLTAHLARLEGMDVLYLKKVTSATNPVRLVTRDGSRLPAHQAALGIALLSCVDEGHIDRLVRETMVDRGEAENQQLIDRLVRETAVAREQGFAVEDGRVSDGVTCIAAPVRNSATGIPLAVGVTGLSTRFQGDFLREASASVARTATRLTDRFLPVAGTNV